MHTRDEVLREYAGQNTSDATHLVRYSTVKSMADEIVRLRNILDNLTGPSANVMEDVRVVANGRYGYSLPDDVLAELIRTALYTADEV